MRKGSRGEGQQERERLGFHCWQNMDCAAGFRDTVKCKGYISAYHPSDGGLTVKDLPLMALVGALPANGALLSAKLHFSISRCTSSSPLPCERPGKIAESGMFVCLSSDFFESAGAPDRAAVSALLIPILTNFS